jgi:hypothetical protein
MNTELELKQNLSQLLENSHLKPVLYNSALSLAQFVALHKLKPFSEQTVPVSGKKIIIHSVHGTYLSAIYKEGAFALALRLAGHDAKMLFCDQRISSCCALFTLDHPASKRDCKNCVHFSKSFCSLLNIPYLSYNDFSVPEDRLEQFLSVGNVYPEGQHKPESIIYKGVHIGRHAETGTQRYFKGKEVPKEIYHKHFISKLVDASVVVDIAERIQKEEKPDIIITSHSCYSEFGPFSEFFKNAGIPVFTWFTGYEPNTLVFDLPEVGKNFKKYLDKNGLLHSGSELIELESFISKRKSGMGESKFYGFTSSNEELGLPKEKIIFGMFPNSPWDADPSCATLFFDSIQSWVEETIQFFINHQNYFLIVKTHPSEKLYHSRTTVYDIIKTKFPTLPENILLLPPDTTVSAYELFKNLNVGIVSNTTTGLEMMLSDVPVITVGEAHYRGKGFTYDPKTKKEYFDLLERGFFILFNKEKMQKYAYYYFIKSFIPYNVFYKKNFLNIGFSFKTLNELNDDKNMNHIVDCITNGRIFQDW